MRTIATIRFITADNAAPLGYSPTDEFYGAGGWVLEMGVGDEWETDLTADPMADVAMREAEHVLTRHGLTGPVDWERLPANYGNAWRAAVTLS